MTPRKQGEKREECVKGDRSVGMKDGCDRQEARGQAEIDPERPNGLYDCPLKCHGAAGSAMEFTTGLLARDGVA